MPQTNNPQFNAYLMQQQQSQQQQQQFSQGANHGQVCMTGGSRGGSYPQNYQQQGYSGYPGDPRLASNYPLYGPSMASDSRWLSQGIAPGLSSGAMGSAEAEFRNDFIEVFPMQHLEPKPDLN